MKRAGQEQSPGRVSSTELAPRTAYPFVRQTHLGGREYRGLGVPGPSPASTGPSWSESVGFPEGPLIPTCAEPQDQAALDRKFISDV